jgi:radical SAM-linked protein
MWSEMELETANERARDTAEGTAAVPPPVDATAVVRFAIDGMLRFLSHAETLRLFERACARARVPVKYTQGYNPHPKLSLPLPRSVGVAADDELLVLRVHEVAGFPLGEAEEAARQAWQERVRDRLAAELPADVVLHSVTLERSSASFAPESAQYVLALREIGDADAAAGLRARAADLLASESLVLDRISPKKGGARRVDVRAFLRSIRFEGSRAIVECGISNAGAIRVGEIMTLLGVEPADLVAPIRRQNILWKAT